MLGGEMLQNVAVALGKAHISQNMLLWLQFWRGTLPVWGAQQHYFSFYTYFQLCLTVLRAQGREWIGSGGVKRNFWDQVPRAVSLYQLRTEACR